MYPKLIHIYGPLELNSYNVSIILGLALFFFATFRHRTLENFISKTDFFSLCIESAIAGIIGARLLHVVSDWQAYHSLFDMISLWDGGLSILGALAGVFLYSLWTLHRKKLPIFAVYDIGALYIPLAQAMGRIGCFLVGCCYGCQTSVVWGITYTHPQVLAPLNVSLHPTQLYSSLIFFGIFIVLYFFVAKRVTRSGELSMAYLMAMSFERWFVDFFRGDRIMLSFPHPFSLFSFHQWVALLVFVCAGTVLLYLRSSGQRTHDAVLP